MSERLVGALTRLWIKGGASRRGEVERFWPELAEAIDMVMISTHIRIPEPEVDLDRALRQTLTTAGVRRIPKANEKRCEATVGIKVWPYVTRCVLVAGHPLPNDHIDEHGKEWKVQTSCDGCRTIERLRLQVPAGDEEAFYQFQRAERKHRRECPNR